MIIYNVQVQERQLTDLKQIFVITQDSKLAKEAQSSDYTIIN